MKSFLPLNPAKSDSQGIGATLTYLRRYSLSAIVGVVCDDDDDGEAAVGRGKQGNGHQAKQEQQAAAPKEPEVIERLGKAEIIAITTLIQKLDEESNKSFLDWIKRNFNAASLQDIPKAGYEKCMASLNAKIKYLNDKNSMAVA